MSEVKEGTVQGVRKNPQMPKRMIIIALILILLLVVALNSWTVVQGGTVGVVSVMGAIQEQVFEAGFHLKAPFVSSVEMMNIQTQKLEVDASAASKDLQVISTSVALNFHVDSASASRLYRTVGKSYQLTIISPAIQESVKAVIARFSAEELITKRQEVSLSMREEINQKILSYGLIVDDFNIINLDFSAEFNAAIEAKQTAQQQALKAEQDLARVKIEAQQKVEQAKAEAEATRARAEAEAYAIEMIQKELERSEQYIEYQKVEKWNGELPLVSGDSSAIIDLSGIKSRGGNSGE